MPKETLYKVRATKGVIFRGEALKAGDEVQATAFEAHAIVGAKRGEYVDGEPKESGPMTAAGAGKATVKGK